MGPRRVAADSILIFELRRAHVEASPGVSQWEAWQLYDSGRFVYMRSGAEPSRTRLDHARLGQVHRWLAQHDFELVRSRARLAPALTTGESASCQLRLSTGLVLAPLGDPRFYACDALRQLGEGEPEPGPE